MKCDAVVLIIVKMESTGLGLYRMEGGATGPFYVKFIGRRNLNLLIGNFIVQVH